MSTAASRSAVAHLARRAGFGATEQEVDALARGGYAEAVESFVTGLGTPDAAADAVPAPTFDTTGYLAARDGTKQEKQAARRQARRERTGLVVWWLRRMAVAEHPLREKLTLLWHDHFATSIQKVKLPELMAAQRQTLYDLGGGRFDTLVSAMVRDPAMLVWLDGGENVAGRPNENFAREFLELFTLGHGGSTSSRESTVGTATHAGHGAQPYTEADVVGAARAFTGWRVQRADVASVYRPNRHDTGADKVVLGRTGALGADDVVAAAVAHPACAPHVVSRLWSRLARPAGPADGVVRELAEPFADDLDVTALLRRLFLHPEFLAPASRHGLVKMPIELVVGAARALGVGLGPDHLGALVALGQVPFLPPDVSGWPANEGWLSTSSAHARLELAGALAGAADLGSLGSIDRAARPAAVARTLGVDAWTRATSSALTAAPDPPTLVTLALIAPEHVLA